MLVFAPVSGIHAGAVTVDINDNYDAGLIKQENDGNGADEGIAASSASSSASSASSSASSSGASNQGTSTATPTAASSTASTTAPETTTTTTTTTTDLPKTGDDNRLMITFIAMLASFSVFLTALVGGKHIGKNE